MFVTSLDCHFINWCPKNNIVSLYFSRISQELNQNILNTKITFKIVSKLLLSPYNPWKRFIFKRYVVIRGFSHILNFFTCFLNSSLSCSFLLVNPHHWCHLIKRRQRITSSNNQGPSHLSFSRISQGLNQNIFHLNHRC